MSVEYEKSTIAHVEGEKHALERVDGTEVDSEKSNFSDNEANHRPKLTDFKFVMILIGFGMAFVGSQVQPLLFAAITPLVSAELRAPSLLIWFFTTQHVAIGFISPFAGPLADLFGRKPITIAGLISSMSGMILCAATPSAAGYIGGQALAGMGIAVQELMAIAAIVEIVPTEYRGYYAALVITSFLPFAPASLYGELIAKTNWRYNAALIAIWNFLTALVIFIFYNPPPRVNAAGLSRREMFKRIDFLGGCLMSAGVVIFLVGFNWGGQAYPWHSTKVITFLTVGLVLFCIFLLYEGFVARYPMFPRRLLQRPRTFIALMLVILLAGINYVSVTTFWVLEGVGVYDSNKTELGIRTLPYGFCILGGAIISAIMVSTFKNHLRSIMTFFTVVQVSCIASLAAVDLNNINTVWPPLVLGLIGVGGVLVPNQIIVTIICPDDLIATATCLTVCLRAIGQLTGTSIFYTQFVSVLTADTYKYVVDTAVRSGLTDIPTLKSMMSTLLSTPWKEWILTQPSIFNPTALHEVIIKAMGLAFQRIWFMSIAFGGSAVIASLFIEDLGKLMDGHIAVHYF